MLVGIRTLFNSEALTRKYLRKRRELYGAVTNRGANTVRIILSALLGQMIRKTDPERSGSDLRTHVVCLFPKNRSELTGN